MKATRCHRGQKAETREGAEATHHLIQRGEGSDQEAEKTAGEIGRIARGGTIAMQAMVATAEDADTIAADATTGETDEAVTLLGAADAKVVAATKRR